MYAELQCKTNFSFLRGASDAKEMIRRAFEIGVSAVAITDVNGVYALPRAYEAIKNYPTVKLIAGCELLLIDHPPVTLIARNRAAYGLMCRIMTAAHAGKSKGKAELSIPELVGFIKQKEAQGLICLFPCLISKKLNYALFRDLFQDRLFIALTFYLDGLDEERILEVRRMSKEWNLRIVATNDVHYHTSERRALQDVLTCIREGVTLKSAGFKLFSNEERYLKSPLQMKALFRDLPDAIQATLDIAASCVFSLSELSYQYPSEWIPSGYTSQKYLEELVWKGARSRYQGVVPIEVENQMVHEFSLIDKMNYSDYFLTVYDIVDFAKKNNIYCQGRGSAANSIVCYCLGITVIDPVRTQLLFERFMSEERGEPPDIDVDFEHHRREEVIQYIYHKYGRNRAAMISAVRTYRRRSAFIEIAKAFGVPVGTLSANELEDQFEQLAGIGFRGKEKMDQLVSSVLGFPRHLSIHACGFTLSAHPVIDTVPIEPARMPGRTICQWDKHDLDTLKLIKIDVLGLGFLSVIHQACDLLGIHFSEIPQEDDPQVYRMIQRGDTIGTFQIESRAQIATLGVTQPACFYDLVVEVALVRPGPNVGEMKHPYILRRDNAKKGIPYLFEDPVIEKILGRTYGVPIFQEQVMKLAVDKAGFSLGESDQLRRAIAGWRSESAEDPAVEGRPIDRLSHRFYEGLIAGGIAEEKAKELFGYLKGFSSYGFPESHAASFATLSYISAWLKFYHPAELLVGLLNSQPMGFYSIDVLIHDARRHGVKVLPMNPNLSEAQATQVNKMTVQMGLTQIRGIQKVDIDYLVEERKRGYFKGVSDFIKRTRFSRDLIATLSMCDFFSCFGLDQRHSFWKSIELQSLFDVKSIKLPQQLNLFKDSQESSQSIFKGMTVSEEIAVDYRELGYSLRGNWMKMLRSEKESPPIMRSSEVKRLPHGALVTYAGVVMCLQRPSTAKGVAFITLEDEVGSVDLICFRKVYERYQNLIRSAPCLTVKGKIERRGQSLSLIVGFMKSYAVR